MRTGNMVAEPRKFVWVERDSGRIRRVPVSIGIDNGSNIEILSGLKEGDKIVVAMTYTKAKPSKSQNTRRRPLIL
jgi:multidrug efflux pump subunit AcrA (membrane-fusion protein)